MTFDLGAVVGDDLEKRRDDLRNSVDPLGNGIDYLTVDPADHRRVRVTFLRNLPLKADPTKDAYGLVEHPREQIIVTGGTRVLGVEAVSATITGLRTIDVVFEPRGDLGTYTLALVGPDLDPPLSTVPLRFAAPCPTDIDCEAPGPVDVEVFDEPLIDYLAKDDVSFRRLLTDLARSRNPRWIEQSPADLAVTILELLAYEGDRISYFQDAAAGEAYLETARARRSVRRHARLVDYPVHDGRNAWTWAVFTVSNQATLAAGTPVLSRIEAPLAPGQVDPPGLIIPVGALQPIQRAGEPGNPPHLELPAALLGVSAFETAHPVACSPRNNEIQIHGWGRDRASLPAGSTEAHLFSVGPTGLAVRPDLAEGDWLVLEEVRGAEGPGRPSDADPHARQAVRINAAPQQGDDPIYSATLAAGADGRFVLQASTGAADRLPLLRVTWSRGNALTRPLRISTVAEDGVVLHSVGVARGNVAVVDHGQTVSEPLSPLVPSRTPVELAPTLGPLTHAAPVATGPGGVVLPSAVPPNGLGVPASACRPVVQVTVTTTTGVTDVFRPVPDLLDSGPYDNRLVAEVDERGDVVLRFGDGTYGSDPVDASSYVARYRVGNGRAGNVAAEVFAHVAPGANAPTITKVRNPLPAIDGEAAEALDHVRVSAPEAFKVDQPRAITEADYAAAARRLPDVQDAAARFRWTGSWWTVFVGIDPLDPADLIDRADGRTGLSERLTTEVLRQLSVVRQAGYDLEVRPPTFVPIELDLDVCVATGHFRSDVVEALRDALGKHQLTDGSLAFFHPTRWTFGAPLWLSSVYAAAEAVPGVDSVVITRLRRLGQVDNGELDRGVVVTGPWEIIRCSNDPNFPDHGVLRLTAHGGKG